MRTSQSLTEAEALADRLYSGPSRPLTVPKRTDRPLDCDWWREPRKPEDFDSPRHKAPLRLFLELARSSLIPLGNFCFPSSFDFSGGQTRNPDKGFVKMCLNSDPPILTCRMLQSHLVFDITDDGKKLLESE